MSGHDYILVSTINSKMNFNEAIVNRKDIVRKKTFRNKGGILFYQHNWFLQYYVFSAFGINKINALGPRRKVSKSSTITSSELNWGQRHTR